MDIVHIVHLLFLFDPIDELSIELSFNETHALLHVEHHKYTRTTCHILLFS